MSQQNQQPKKKMIIIKQANSNVEIKYYIRIQSPNCFSMILLRFLKVKKFYFFILSIRLRSFIDKPIGNIRRNQNIIMFIKKSNQNIITCVPNPILTRLITSSNGIPHPTEWTPSIPLLQQPEIPQTSYPQLLAS